MLPSEGYWLKPGIAKALKFFDKKLKVKTKITVTLGLHPQGVLAEPEIRKTGGEFHAGGMLFSSKS